MADNSQLREQLLKLDVPVFAVLDGAQFDDLPAKLFDGDFVHKPLYRNDNVGSLDQIRTAPQLVWLDSQSTKIIKPADMRTRELSSNANANLNPAVLDSLLTLVGNRPASVFWACPSGGDALYRHLRTINMVSIPAGTDIYGDEMAVEEEQDDLDVDSTDEPGTDTEDETEPTKEELVIFRHSDSNVMAQTLPVLDGPQLARLFGPATGIVFEANREWSGVTGPTVIARPIDLPRAPSGPLYFGPDLLAQMGERRVDVSRENILAYLKDSAPEYTEKLSESELRHLVVNAERTGDEIGFQSEYGHGLWALLLLMTGQSLINSPEIRNHFASSERTPDELVEELVEELADAEDETWDGWTA